MIGHTLGHYRILEKIGAGGMGEVYRAHDDSLDRDVALKVLPQGALANEAAKKQFRKEALALAKLNHPNIETVHEFNSQDGVDFLAMELIPGFPLSQKLREGPLAEKEILRVGRQFAEGLAVAHEHGVIHRDLKPGNLMITPDGRLKILDFGLARLLQSAQDLDLTQSVTIGTGSVSGTVPYMSPEQLRGLPVDARSDIYAAGAVFYEMATGQRPFPHAQSAELVGAILHEPPGPPSAHNPRITSALERIILKALEKDPAQRYQSAREVLVALEGVQDASAAPSAAAAKRVGVPPRRAFVAAGVSALAIVLLLGLALGLNLGGLRDRTFRRAAAGVGRGGATTSPVRARRSVAVLGFKNVSERADQAWLSTALSEMLTTELAAGEHLRTIPGENVARLKVNLSLPDADSYSPDTLAKIRKNLSADDVVLGSYIPLSQGQIRVDLRLQDTSAGEILAAVSDKGAEAKIDDLVSRIGAALRQKLGVSEVSAAEEANVRAALPQNTAAAQLYSAGLQKLRLTDYLGARDLLEKTVEAEPNFALGHSALAVAWKGLGYDAKARDAAKKALDLSANLSRQDRLWIEGQSHEMMNEWPKAVESYRALFGFFPDNLDYGLRLASAQSSAGGAKDALSTVQTLRALPPPASDDPRIDLAEAVAASAVGNYQLQHDAAAKATGKADSQGARLLAAQARISLCSSLRYLGKPKESIATCEEAKRIFSGANFRVDAARALNNIGVVLMEESNYADAKKIYEEALATDREVGDKKAQGMVLNNLAGVHRGQGDSEGARKMLEQALGNFREIADRGGVARALDNIGILLTDQGRLREAAKNFRESLAVCRELGNKSLTAYALYLQGDVSYAQGNLSAARGSYEEALAIRKQLGDPHAIADTQLALASLSIEEGKYSQAEAAAREQAGRYQSIHSADNEALADAVLSRALRAQGKLAEARDAISRATSLSQPGADASVSLAVRLEAARVRAASGNAADVSAAEKDLQGTLAEATKQGLLRLQLEARLALGEIERQAGESAAGRARLAALEKDAREKGYLLVARRAHAAAAQ